MLVLKRIVLFGGLLAASLLLFVPAQTAQAATFTVGCGATRVNDLILAINSANSTTANDIINLGNCTYTIGFIHNSTTTFGANGLPIIDSAATGGTLTINGNGAIIERASGAANFRLLFVNSGGVLTLNTITLRGGNLVGFDGGALYNNGGSVTIADSTFSGNTGSSGSSGAGSGGGFFNASGGTVTVTHSTFSANSGNGGGAFRNASSATVNVINSTFSGNQSPASAGAGFHNRGTVTVTLSTFSDHSGSGATVFNLDGSVTLNNSIIANSSGDHCFSNGGSISGSHNVVETACEAGFGGTVSLSNTLSGDPNLGALANNGGATQTHALLSGSIALDAGSNSLLGGATTDQRRAGFPRVVAATVDIGAFEAACPSSPITVPASDEAGLIRAIHCANSDGVVSVIHLTPSTYTLTRSSNAPRGIGPNGLPAIIDDELLSLVGNGATIERSRVAITPQFRLLYVDINATVFLSRLTLTDGNSSTGGGALLTREGSTVQLESVTFIDNLAAGSGGAVFNAGIISSLQSTFFRNTSTVQGGALHNVGSMTLLNSTVSGNSAPSGGGFSNAGGTTTLKNSIIANNTGGDCLVTGGSVAGSHNLLETPCATSGGTNSLSQTLIGDPALGPLTGNPGFFLLNDFSPAIDAGSNTHAFGLSNDQAGLFRFIDDSNVADTGVGTAPIVDLGSTERQSPSLPAVSINDVTLAEGNSGITTFNFVITLSHAISAPVQVDIVTGNGSAVAPEDYIALPLTTLTFNPGETIKTVTVNVNGDITFEPDETFVVDLSNPVNANVLDNRGIGTITNDDNRPVIRVNDLARTEGGIGVQTNLPFTVTLSNPSHQTITVQFATSDGTATTADSDYTPFSLTTLTFSPGVTSRNVTVKLTGDAKHEPHETLNFNLSNPANASIADNLGVGTIANDDSKPTISVNDVSRAEGNSGTTNFPFVVTLSNPSHQTITVNFATSNGIAAAGVDYTARSGSLSFAPGVTSRNLTVVGNGDTIVEPNETFNFNLSNPTNASIADSVGVGTITNDDAAGLSEEGVQIVPVAPELPQFVPVAPVMPDAPSVELPGVMLVSPIHATSENPVAFTWIGTADAVEYRVLVQNQADRSVVVDVVVSAATCNGNICVLVSQFAPQAGVSYVWTVTPITAAGAGQPSAEAGFSYNPSAPDGIELPGTVIGG